MTLLWRWPFYLKMYYHFLVLALKNLLVHRWNFIARVLYAPAYVLVMYLLVWIAFDKAPILGGWTAQEGMFFFTVFHLNNSLSRMAFSDAINKLLGMDIRLGRVDFALVKPINTQFLLTMGQPSLHGMLIFLSMLGILFFQFSQMVLTLPQLFWFVVWFILSMLISYFTISTFAVLGFYMTKAVQVIEFYYKMSDYGQYPNNIFPGFIQSFSITIIPIAFFSYLPTRFLLGQGQASEIVYGVVFLHLLFLFNQWAWKKGLQQYSSASS